MPKLRYVGPAHFRVLLKSDLGLEGEEEDVITWQKDGEPQELSDEQAERLYQLTGHSHWVEVGDESASESTDVQEPDVNDESIVMQEESSSIPGSDEGDQNAPHA